MGSLREKFLKAYANIPLALRDDVIVLIPGEVEGQDVPVSWNVAYLEVKNDSPGAQAILARLRELELL